MVVRSEEDEKVFEVICGECNQRWRLGMHKDGRSGMRRDRRRIRQSIETV
jgi:hypothetical protein